MEKGFFIKYREYKTGLRFVITEMGHHTVHNQTRQPDDEVFDKGFISLLALQRRLKELYPKQNFLGYEHNMTAGEIHFTYLFQELLLLAERVKRKQKKK